MAKIIGIDLGTSNSAASVMEAGKAVIIPKAIVEFKQSSFQTQSVNNSNACGSRVMHPVASKMLQGVA